MVATELLVHRLGLSLAGAPPTHHRELESQRGNHTRDEVTQRQLGEGPSSSPGQAAVSRVSRSPRVTCRCPAARFPPSVAWRRACVWPSQFGSLLGLFGEPTPLGEQGGGGLGSVPHLHLPGSPAPAFPETSQNCSPCTFTVCCHGLAVVGTSVLLLRHLRRV